jgi:hypothetical protein
MKARGHSCLPTKEQRPGRLETWTGIGCLQHERVGVHMYVQHAPPPTMPEHVGDELGGSRADLRGVDPSKTVLACHPPSNGASRGGIGRTSEGHPE